MDEQKTTTVADLAQTPEMEARIDRALRDGAAFLMTAAKYMGFSNAAGLGITTDAGMSVALSSLATAMNLMVTNYPLEEQQDQYGRLSSYFMNLSLEAGRKIDAIKNAPRDDAGALRMAAALGMEVSAPSPGLNDKVGVDDTIKTELN
jgi:hypothetical protein